VAFLNHTEGWPHAQVAACVIALGVAAARSAVSSWPRAAAGSSRERAAAERAHVPRARAHGMHVCARRGSAEGKAEGERAGQARSPFWRGARVADESRHAGAAAPGGKPRDVELGAAAAAQGHHRSPGAQPVAAAAPARAAEA
jgi:hypothetical protein